MPRAPWFSTDNYRPYPGPTQVSRVRVTQPSLFPVTRTEARLNCRAGTDPDDEDALYNIWLNAATGFVETEARTFISPCTVRFTFDRFPCGDDFLVLSPGPIREVTEIAYLDEAGDTQVIDRDEVAPWLDHNPPLVGYSTYWPAVYANSLVQVTADVGYETAAEMPGPFAQAVLVLVTLFETRRDLVDKNGEIRFPGAVRSLAASAGLGGYG